MRTMIQKPINTVEFDGLSLRKLSIHDLTDAQIRHSSDSTMIRIDVVEPGEFDAWQHPPWPPKRQAVLELSHSVIEALKRIV